MEYKIIRPHNFRFGIIEHMNFIKNDNYGIVVFARYNDIIPFSASCLSYFSHHEAINNFFVEDSDIDPITVAIMLINQNTTILYKPEIKPIFTKEEKQKAIQVFLYHVLSGFHPNAKSFVVDQKILDMFQTIWDMFEI